MYIVMIICAVISTVVFLLWLFLFIKYRNQYVGMLDDIDGQIFTLKDVYFVGLGLIEIYENMHAEKIINTPKAVIKRKELAEIFGSDSADLYYYITISAKISLIITILPIGLGLACMIQSMLGLLCGILISFVFPYGIQSGINTATERKKDAIISEFPKMVSKLTLLINAGMPVRRAWDEVANSNFENDLYAEMRTVSKNLLEGYTIEQAISDFARRCGLKEIRKFSSIYVQTVNRGAEDSISSMRIMADEAWEQKKQISKQKGEIASQKLLIPNMIMFCGILVVVVVPMIAGMFGAL